MHRCYERAAKLLSPPLGKGDSDQSLWQSRFRTLGHHAVQRAWSTPKTKCGHLPARMASGMACKARAYWLALKNLLRDANKTDYDIQTCYDLREVPATRSSEKSKSLPPAGLYCLEACKETKTRSIARDENSTNSLYTSVCERE
eukprot:6192926-Pleurochrysis_carterae.AAC.1